MDDWISTTTSIYWPLSGFPPEINVSVVAFQNNMKIWEREIRAAIVFARRANT